jgi:ribosomal protein L29
MERKNHNIRFSKRNISQVETGNGKFKTGAAHSELRNKKMNQLDHCVHAYKRMLRMSREIKSLATSFPPIT